jgi:hypothetical protein
MLDNGHSLIVEARKVQFTAPESSMKYISGMVDLVRGIVSMGSAQNVEFQWVPPQGVVTPVDIKLVDDQLETFTNSRGHMLHAKIVADAVVNQKDSGNIGVTRDGVAALASKKSVADIICHAGNFRKYSVNK